MNQEDADAQEVMEFADASCLPWLAASTVTGIIPQDPGEFVRMHTILVVDDEPLIRWAVREGLESAGFQVLEAGSAGEALAKLGGAAAGVDVALLDIRLPDSDDLGLLKRMRNAAPSCRVIMMTAHGTPELLAEAIRAGAFATLSKPFDMSGMIDVVRAAGAAA
jgi:DNA-binding NtrC family response regulator